MPEKRDDTEPVIVGAVECEDCGSIAIYGVNTTTVKYLTGKLPFPPNAST